MQLWTKELIDCYWSQGYACIPGLIPEDKLIKIEEAIDRLVLMEAARASLLGQYEQMDRLERIHVGLLGLPEENRRVVVDKINQSEFCRRIFATPEIIELFKTFTRAKLPEDIGVSNFFVRVDLPGQDEESVRKFSLPWHQDGGYYPRNSCPKTSLVMWFPLFDCNKEDGCLEACLKSHTDGPVHHDEYFILPEEKKHWRVEVPNQITNTFEKGYAQCPRGSANLFHMSLIHRSGFNASDRIRYSFIIRASNLLSPTYVI